MNEDTGIRDTDTTADPSDRDPFDLKVDGVPSLTGKQDSFQRSLLGLTLTFRFHSTRGPGGRGGPYLYGCPYVCECPCPLALVGMWTHVREHVCVRVGGCGYVCARVSVCVDMYEYCVSGCVCGRVWSVRVSTRS